MNQFTRGLLGLTIGLVTLVCSIYATAEQASPQPLPIPSQALPIKVVVVSMFEHGEVTGDRPGEFQYWVERMPLAQSIEFPMGPFPLRYREDGVLGLVTGGGIANATATIMALGLDPRFDLSNSYWLIAGIAGGDPMDSTLGSAVTPAASNSLTSAS